MRNDNDQPFSEAGSTALDDDLEGPRVTEIPLVGDYFPLRLPQLDRVNMKDVLWFSPHPPPIESAEIPADPDEDRPSVAPMAIPVAPDQTQSEGPPRARFGSSLNPALSFGVLGALIAAAYFVQPQRLGSPIAELALAFPDRVVIDMTEPLTPIAVEDLPVAGDPEAPEETTAEVDAKPKRPTAIPGGSFASPSQANRIVELSTPAKSGPILPPVEPPKMATMSMPPFNSSDALTAIHAAAGSAASCVPPSGPNATRVSVTYAPSGRVTQSTIVSGALVGTNEGGCVARALRSARIDPYAGPPVTVHRTIRLR